MPLFCEAYIINALFSEEFHHRSFNFLVIYWDTFETLLNQLKNCIRYLFFDRPSSVQTSDNAEPASDEVFLVNKLILLKFSFLKCHEFSS